MASGSPRGRRGRERREPPSPTAQGHSRCGGGSGDSGGDSRRRDPRHASWRPNWHQALRAPHLAATSCERHQLLGPHLHSPKLGGHPKPGGWGRRSSTDRWGCGRGTAQACPRAWSTPRSPISGLQVPFAFLPRFLVRSFETDSKLTGTARNETGSETQQTSPKYIPFLDFPTAPGWEQSQGGATIGRLGNRARSPVGRAGLETRADHRGEAGPGGSSRFAHPVAAGPWVESGTPPWAFSGCRIPLPSHVPGPARLGLGTTRPPQQGARASLPRRRGSQSKPPETRAAPCGSCQGPAPWGSRLSQRPLYPPFLSRPRSLGPPGAGSEFGKMPPPREARAGSLGSKEGRPAGRRRGRGRAGRGVPGGLTAGAGAGV